MRSVSGDTTDNELGGEEKFWGGQTDGPACDTRGLRQIIAAKISEIPFGPRDKRTAPRAFCLSPYFHKWLIDGHTQGMPGPPGPGPGQIKAREDTEDAF